MVSHHKQEKHFLTKEGYEKMLEELRHLKDEKLPLTLARLKEAISQGDISENAEYDTAMTEKDLIYGRIAEIEYLMENVEIIEHTEGGVIRYGSKVTVKDDKDRTYDITFVGSGEVDVLEGTVSFESPLGSALRGKKKGDTVSVKAPSRRYTIEVVNVK